MKLTVKERIALIVFDLFVIMAATNYLNDKSWLQTIGAVATILIAIAVIIRIAFSFIKK